MECVSRHIPFIRCSNSLYLLFRAESGTRTRDLRITNALLYQLSYFGVPLIKRDCSRP